MQRKADPQASIYVFLVAMCLVGIGEYGLRGNTDHWPVHQAYIGPGAGIALAGSFLGCGILWVLSHASG